MTLGSGGSDRRFGSGLVSDGCDGSAYSSVISGPVGLRPAGVPVGGSCSSVEPVAFSAVSEPAPLPVAAPQSASTPSDAKPGDFACRLESQLPFLHTAARRWRRDKASTDDLVQDTIVRALANAHLWQPDQPES